MVHHHVGEGAEHDDQGHQHHDQPEHAEGDHLEYAVVFWRPVLGEHPDLQSKRQLQLSMGTFLAPTGALGVTICVRLSVCPLQS